MKPILKTHYSATELASMQVNGIPDSREGVRILAEREAWPRQKRNGRGGGFEYLPPETIMAQIRARQAQQLLATAAQLPTPAAIKTLPVKTARREEQMALPLTDAQQLRASARKGVLLAVKRLMEGCGISKESALTALLVEAKKEPAGHMAKMLTNAQDERGRRGSDLPNPRTIKRWFAQEAEGTLAPKTRQKDMTVPDWASAFLAVWQTPQKPSVELAYHLFAKEWDGNRPSVHQVRRFIAKLGNVSREVGRMGSREIKTIKPYIRRTFEHLWPNDVWSADGHCFDAEVAHPFTGKAFRPEITTIVDIATRRAVGFSIGLAESSFAVLDAIRFAAERCGITAIFYVDNGSGYQNDMMKNEATGLMGRLGISIEHSLPYNSQARGVIERLHQTLWVKAAKLLPSYMGHDMDGEAKQRQFKLTRKALAGKAEQTGLLAWDAFMRLCDDTVAAYNDKPHRSLGGLSPNEAWAQKIATNQLELTFIQPGEIDALFRPRTERVVNRGQVTLFSNTFFSHALTEFHSETVQVGYDIHDANQVWVYDADGRFITRAEWNANARDYFPQSVVEQARERRAEGRIKRAEVKIADANAERHGRPAIEAPEEIVIPGMVGTIKRSDLYKNAPSVECAEEEYGCVPRKSGGSYLSRPLIEQAMVADHSIRIYRYEASDDFMTWTPERREKEIKAWCRENLQPELARLSKDDRHAFGEDFARRGDLTVFTPLAISPLLRKRVLDMEGFEDLLLDALDGIGHGFAAQEIEWGRLGKLWYPQGFNLRPQRWFKTLHHDGNALRLRNSTPEGEELQPFGWITHIHKAKSGYLTRGGLHRILAWPYLFKNYSVRDLAEFLEIYGLPMRIGKYTTGASDKEKATLLRAVTEIGHNAAGIIPQGMAIEFEAAAAGSHDPFEAMTNWCERTQSKAILGGTLTSQADGKSSTNALGNVHNEVRHDLLVSDARQLEGTLTRDLIWPWIAINKGGIDPRRCPRLKFDTREAEDLAVYAEALPELVGLGMRIKRSWAHEKLNIPEATEDEPVLAAARPDMMLPPELRQEHQPAAASAQFQAALSSDVPPQHPDQEAMDAIELPADLLAEGMDKALAPVISAIKNGADPEEAISKLAEAYPAIDDDTIAELLARCLFVADIWGRVNGRN